MNIPVLVPAQVRALLTDLERDYRTRVGTDHVRSALVDGARLVSVLHLEQEPDALRLLDVAVRHRLDIALGEVDARSRLRGSRQPPRKRRTAVDLPVS